MHIHKAVRYEKSFRHAPENPEARIATFFPILSYYASPGMISITNKNMR